MPQELEEAIAYEQGIATEAASLRGDEVVVTAALLVKLWPLLRRPIPKGFIKAVGVVKGKPYDSTGVSSVQVQIERMDNVLGPLGWDDITQYTNEGRLAHVQVRILGESGVVLVQRESWGGVDRASTEGNLRKGSYTNAAKVAFARIGPGHEVYLGATDLDPDVHEGAAAEQVKPSRLTHADEGSPRLLTAEEREKVMLAVEGAGYAADGVEMLLAAVGASDPASLTVVHAFELRKILDEKAEKEGSV
jgi:hypothetical protein